MGPTLSLVVVSHFVVIVCFLLLDIFLQVSSELCPYLTMCHHEVIWRL